MRKLAITVLVVVACSMSVLPITTAGAGADAGVRVVNFNILHGLFCAPETDGCQASDRVDLFAQQLEESKCPEIVGLQEVNIQIGKELDRIRKTVCDGEYKVVFGGKAQSSDTERVFTTLKVKSKKVLKLFGGFRTASRVVLSSPGVEVVLVVTHQDGDPETPSTTCRICKPPCKADLGVFDCQTDAAVDLTESVGGPKAFHVLMGDFNVDPTSARYQRIVAGGFIDSHLAAGNAECVEATGVNCTSGRDDKSVVALKDPAAKESQRIDFIFVKPPSACEPEFDTVDDSDGDGLGTGLFFPEPATDGPGGIVWVSDHTGVSADFTCE